MSSDIIDRPTLPIAVRLDVRESAGRGLGVFAGQPIAEGTTVLVFGGPLLHLAEIGDFSHCLQVGHDRFLGESSGIDDLVNHSCNPNCGVVHVPGGHAELKAIRNIETGEEVAYDYSTCMRDEPAMTCACGSASCRRRIQAFVTLEPRLRARYLRLGIVPEFAR
jgi:uncharacterized protein